MTIPSHPGQHNRDSAACDRVLSHRSLVLEDNALIAMEIELLLSDLGAKAVDVAASVAEALALIAGNAYEFALLDVNLGGETSRRAADALAASGVPHVFATGYGILPWDAPGQVRMPVLIKPFDAFDLRKAVVTAQALAAR